jgi:hypothetical protein
VIISLRSFDGTTVRGPAVTWAFAPGDTVEDEFGASESLRWTVGEDPAAAGPGDDSSDPVAVPFDLSPAVLGLLVGVGVVVAFVLVRIQLVGEPLFSLPVASLGAILQRRSPRVTLAGDPTWDEAARAVVVPGLTVEGGRAPLERVEMTVADADGVTVVGKTVDVTGRRDYRPGHERIRLPAGVDVAASGYWVTVRVVDGRDRSDGEWTLERLATA